MARTGMRPTEKSALVVGVAGIMGSGKTTVAKVFEDQGAVRIDADLMGRELLEDHGVKPRIVEAFGSKVLNADGGIDSARLARAAFAGPDSARKLDGVTRGPLIEKIRGRIRDLAGSAEVVVVDAALLPEWSPREWIDVLVVVDSDEEAAVRRASRSSRFKPADIRARMRHQLSRREKSREADVIIPNFGGLDELRERARVVFRTLFDAERDMTGKE
jgi:dephospho-CoA kinase